MIEKIVCFLLSMVMLLGRFAFGADTGKNSSAGSVENGGGGTEAPHTHVFEPEWQSDEFFHWTTCSCGVRQQEEHCIENNKCTVCSYEFDKLPIATQTSVADSSEWEWLFADERFENATITVKVASPYAPAPFYSTVRVDGRKAFANEQLADPSLFDEGGRYYYMTEDGLELFNKNEGKWVEDPLYGEESALRRILSSAFDDDLFGDILIPGFPQMQYNEAEQTYEWIMDGALVAVVTIRDCKFVEWSYTPAEGFLIKMTVEYGNTDVTYPEGVER